MCGIAGILNQAATEPVTERALRRMLALIDHRGPDQFGLYLDGTVGLASSRLAIIDLGGGQQPLCNEDGSLWIVFNGEIFNYRELRPELEARGHRFETDCDTEVLLHLFEESGPDCLARLNGQFAFAIWNARDQTLFLARDRFGIRPLYYTRAKGSLVFGSEIKALLGSGRVDAALDPVGLDQVFTCWSTVSPCTIFKDIVELPPGHWLRAGAGGLEVQRYWQMPFVEIGAEERNPDERLIQQRAEELRELLTDAVRLRLRADVPVAAYLSGGLDSAVVSSLARSVAPGRLHTFSIAFSDAEFDESEFQQQMAAHLGTCHHVTYATHEAIGRVFPKVIWHAEMPMLRTSPAPLFLLAEEVHRHRFKVALTGEGADEMLGGYDLFKEAKIRRFWAAQPGSERRALLLKRLYPDIGGLGRTGTAYLRAFFGEGLADESSPWYSHAIRWRNGLRHRRFYSPELLTQLGTAAPVPGAGLELPEQFMRWGPLDRAQHLEISLFLSNFLLSAQGDRMSMAHAVEGRYPFLDYRVAEFCARLPERLKLRVLREKYLLRRVAAPWLPREIATRRKRPYRAPIHRAFFHERTEDYVRELLGTAALRASGLFQPAAVEKFVTKLSAGGPVGETDDMALAGMLSSQLVYWQFVAHFQAPPPIPLGPNLKCCFRPPSAEPPACPASPGRRREFETEEAVV